MMTLPGDDFGSYEIDPDIGQEPVLQRDAARRAQRASRRKVRYENLNVNFHGGGIWIGTDQDHRVRFGLVNNTFKGGVSVEALRENEDLWPGSTPPGPGNDIQGARVPDIAPSPQPTPIDVILRMVRDGTGTGPGGAAPACSTASTTAPRSTASAGRGSRSTTSSPARGRASTTARRIEGNWKVGVLRVRRARRADPRHASPSTTSQPTAATPPGPPTSAATGSRGATGRWARPAPSRQLPTSQASSPRIARSRSPAPTATTSAPQPQRPGAGIGYTIRRAPAAVGAALRAFNGGQALINVTGGNHEITAPVNYATNTTWNVASGARLRLTGHLHVRGNRQP